MRKRLFDFDPVTRTTEYFYYDEDTDRFTIQTQQDVTDLVESNKAEFNAAPEHGRFRGDMHKVASIPLNVYFDLKAKGILDDEKKLRAWLNDPDNRFFRTRPGRV